MIAVIAAARAAVGKVWSDERPRFHLLRSDDALVVLVRLKGPDKWLEAGPNGLSSCHGVSDPEFRHLQEVFDACLNSLAGAYPGLQEHAEPTSISTKADEDMRVLHQHSHADIEIEEADTPEM